MSSRAIALVIAGAVAVAATLAILTALFLAPDAPLAPQPLQVTTIAPNSGYARSILRAASLAGTGFADSAQVSLERGGVPSVPGTGFVFSGGVLAEGAFELDAAQPGVWNVVVTNPDGGRGVCSGCFTVLPEATPPTVTGLSVSRVAQGANPEIAISGTGFQEGTSVGFSGEGVSVEQTDVISSTELRVRIVLSSVALLETRTVTVTNPDLKTARCADCLAISAGPPSVTALAPSTLGAGARLRAVSLSGTGFQAGAKVAVSGVGIAASEVVVTGSDQLTAKLTVSSTTEPGTRDIVVTNADGQRATCADCLAVSPPPRVSALAPATALPGAQLDALLSGSGFQRGMTLAFSGAGILASDPNFISETQLAVRLALSTSTAPGARILTVTNPDGGSSALRGLFAVSSSTTATAVATSTTSTTP